MSRIIFIPITLIMFTVLLALPGVVSATHIVGGNMTYRCLGNDQYEITLTIRRDCENGAEDAPFDDPAIIGVFDIFGSLQVHIGTVGRLEIPFMGEDTITNSQIYDCSALGTPVCVHESVYRDTLFLPFNKIGYRLAYQRCCRNIILSNIEEPLETGATYHVAIPINVLTECNSQPVFNSWPDVYACVNEDLIMDLSATDADGDQLVYKLCTPSQGATSDNPQPFTPSNPPYPTVVWQPPYGLTNMIGGSPPLTINPSTGEIKAYPNQVGTYLIGVCIEEYRNGQLLSEVRRDFEVNIRVCSDPIELSCVTTGNEECTGNLLIGFENTSVGADFYRWLIVDNQGDTIHINNSDLFDYEFPEYGTYTIILEGTRQSDGCTARKIEELVLGNPDVEADFIAGFVSCDDQNAIFLEDISVDSTGSSFPVAWVWTIDGNFAGNTRIIEYDVSGKDEIEVELLVIYNSGCSATVLATLIIDDLYPEAYFEYELLSCSGEFYELGLQAVYFPSALTPLEIKWTIEAQSYSGMLFGNPVYFEVLDELTVVTLDILFDNGCTATYTEVIDPSSSLVLADINYLVEECIGEDSIRVILDYNLENGNFNAESVFWTINGVDYDSDQVELILGPGMTLNTDVLVFLDNGCAVLNNDLISSDQLFPNLAINKVYDDCPEPGETAILDLSYDINSIAQGYDVDSVAWLVNGVLVIGNSTSLEVVGGEEVQVELFILFENGCTATLSESFIAGLPSGVVDFNASLVSCDSSNLIRFEDISHELYDDADAISWEWIINGTFAGDSSVIFYDPDGFDDVLTVILSVGFDSGCSDDTSKVITVEDLFPEVGFDVELISCVTEDYEVTLISNYTPDYYIIEEIKWTIEDGGVTEMYFGDSITVNISDGASVLLEVSFENDCDDSHIEIVNPSELIPLPDIEYTVIECIGEDSLVVSLDYSLNDEDAIVDSIQWVLNGEIYNNTPIVITVGSGTILNSDLIVYYDNGCSSTVSDSLNTNDLFPEIRIEKTYDDCPEAGETSDLTLSPEIISIAQGYEIDSISWIINGVNYNSESVTITIVGGELVSVELFILFTNGCTAEYAEEFNAGDGGNAVDFTASLESCDSSQIIILEDISGTINNGTEPVSWNWIVNGVFAGDSSVIFYDANGLDEILVELQVEFDNGCSGDTIKTINIADLYPEVDFDYSLVSCVDNGYNILLTSEYNPTHYTATEIKWTIIIDNDSTMYFGPELEIIVPDSTEVILEILFDNDCFDSHSEVIYPSELIPLPDIEYTVIECIGEDSLVVSLDYSLNNEDAIVDSIQWVLNGETFNNTPIVITVGSGTILNSELIVYYDNGCSSTVSESVNTDDLFPEIRLEKTYDDCPEVGETSDLTLSPEIISIAQGYEIDSISWIINGVNYNTESVTITIAGGELVSVELFILFTNGCTAEYAEEFIAGDGGNAVDFTASLESCDSSQIIILEDISGTINNGTVPVSWNWIVNGVFAGDSSVIFYDANGLDEILVELQVEFDNGCSGDTIKTINIADLYPEVDFDYSLVSCVDNGYNILLTSEYVPEHYIATEIKWTIIIDNDSTMYFGPELEIIVPDSTEVILEILFDNDCFDSYTEVIYPSELIPEVEPEYTVAECIGEDSIRLVISTFYESPDSLLAIDSVLWVINGVEYTTNEIEFILALSDTLDISLMAYYNNGCNSFYSEQIIVDDLFPDLEIDYMYDDCPALGELVNITFKPEINTIANGFDIDSLEWNIEGEIYNTEEVTIEVVGGDTIEVSLMVYYENACMDFVSDTIAISFDDMLEIDEEYFCIGDSLKFNLFATSAYEITEYSWYDDNIVYSEFDSSEFSICLAYSDLEDRALTYYLDVQYANGCTGTDSVIVSLEDFFPNLEFDIEIEECIDDSTGVVSINVDVPIEVVWDSLVINGQSFEDLPVLITLPLDSIAILEYFVDYATGCSDTLYEEIIPNDYQVDPEYDIELLDCFDDAIGISIVDITDYDGQFNTEWLITDGDSIYMFSGNIDSLIISNPTITIIQTVYLDNGCIVSDTTEFNQSDILPDLEELQIEFTVEAIECIGDSGIYLFTDLTQAPECYYIINHEWNIDGQICEGNPVTKTLPLNDTIPFSLTVYFNNGLILSTSTDTIDTNDTLHLIEYIDTSGIEIINKYEGLCSDSISLMVANPDSLIAYEWSSDPDFNDILTTGTSLDTVVWPGFEGVIYIQTTGYSGPCEYGLDSIAINMDGIELDIDSFYTVCPGDTAIFSIAQLDSSQNITWLWKDSLGYIIEGGDSSNPLIGLPEDLDEDFYLILCTSNDLGCSAMDTIFFNVSESDTLMPFSYAIDSCGSLTVHFDEAPNMLGDAAVWDFGDGNGANGSMVSHTYDSTGIYTVTLMDTSQFCPSIPISLDISVGMLYVEIQAPDTLYYNPDSLVIITAETNGNVDSISWCTTDGTIVGMGSPIEFDAMMDTVLLIAKITDQFGCFDQDSVLLIPEMDPEECLEELMLDGPLGETICEGDTFVICVVFSDECDPSEYSYLWNPEDCIIDGQGTAKITGVANESKTIMVLVTHLETGIDSVYSYFLNVSAPEPQISVPDINIDENGNPFVCLGEGITLTIDPVDPNCEYYWSDGSVGPSIEIFPEEDISVWVECIDTFGCSGISDTLNISVVPPQCDESDVFIPSAFSPNGDNVNDILFVRSKFIDEMELVIANRWGQEVFRSTDQSIGWDGTYNGSELQPDAYAYTLNVVCVDGQTYVKTGNVTIVK